MLKISKMFGDNLLVQRAEQKDASEFINTNADDNSSVFIIKFPTDRAGQTVLLKPGRYDSMYFSGEVFFVVTKDDVIAELEEAKNEKSNN